MAKALMSTWDYECDEMVGSSEDQAADPDDEGPVGKQRLARVR